MTIPFCRSRGRGRRCTRPLDHAGLHRHRAVMWNDLGADPLRCAGSHAPAASARPLADGFPHGRAVCPPCGAFVALEDGLLAEHDAGVDDVSDAQRALWFNANGW